MMKKCLTIIVLLASSWIPFTVCGVEPGWELGVIRFGAERQKIENTDILQRPYRPFHVYGNAVRRLHYHGRLLPSPRVVSRAARR